MAKKKYEVLHKFIDLEDKNKVYNAGDTYPKPANKKVSHDRILDQHEGLNSLFLFTIQKQRSNYKWLNVILLN